jgi:rubrerythrin
MKVSSFFVLGCLVLLAFVLSTSAIGQSSKSESGHNSAASSLAVGTSLDNLHTAYYAENNESMLYREFAQKADEEKYPQIASMFRAIARAEEIHAAQKADLIRKAGSEPVAEKVSEQSLIGTTRENIEFAMRSEAYEKDVMYPAFIAQARKDNQPDIIRVLNLCLAAEPRHTAMFQQTLTDLEAYRGESAQFLVCPGCGATVRSMGESVCPVCSTPREKFEKVK